MEISRQEVPGPPASVRSSWNFELRIRPAGAASFQVHLLSSPVGDEVAELCLPSSMEEVDRVMGNLAGSVAGTRRHLRPEPPERPAGPGGGGPVRKLEEIGEELFAALFPEPIRRRWRECVEQIATRPGSSLRLVLKSDPTCPATARLHGLPWELLRDPSTGAFLALSRKTQPVRQLALEEAVVLDEPEPARRLRVLVVLACPPGLDPLDLGQERRKIEEAVEGRPDIEATFLADPTFGELSEALRSERFHVLHFMGHGTFDRDADQGYLLLDAPGGAVARVPAERLAEVVRDADSLRLVVLNACETGRASHGGGQPFAGLAHALLRSRIPAVLAMQLPMPDRAAVELSRVFYRQLAAGDAVDEALAEARVAVYASERDGGFGAWAVPVLYVRRPELVIFRPQRQPPVASGRRVTRRLRRSLPVALVVLLTAAIIALYFVRRPWAGVELDAVASGVTFTLAESRSVVDALDLAELAVPNLRRLRHPDPGAGSERTWSTDDLESDVLGFQATAAGDSPGGLSLDDACLPAGTRVELARITPRDLRLSLELPEEGDPRCGGEVTASVGRGVTLRVVPALSEALDLGPGGRLVMDPEGRRIVLDLTLAEPTLAEFHTPLVIGDLQFFGVLEEVVGNDSSFRRVSTLESGSLSIRPLGGGKPEEIEIEPEAPLVLDGLSGRITALTLAGSKGLGVHFRGRVEGIEGWSADGAPVDLMPTWSQSPWVVRLSAASSVLIVALGFFGQLRGVLGWGPERRASGREAVPWDAVDQ